MMKLGQAVADARSQFVGAGLPDAMIEARLLIGGLLGLSSVEVFTHEDRPLDDSDVTRIGAAVARRLKREPVHRILGSREFYGMDLLISTETLEPRPDTEILVDCMLEPMKRLVEKHGDVRILDMGTGTGAIILALLKEIPQATGIGSDISEDALATARRNAERLGLAERFEAVRSHWFDAIAGRFDIIVSNPPYIRSDVIPKLEPEVRDFDPPAALDGGSDGLDAYRAIATGAGAFLKRDGFLAVEIGFDQRDAVTSLFQAAEFIPAQAIRDYGDNDRVLVFVGNSL